MTLPDIDPLVAYNVTNVVAVLCVTAGTWIVFGLGWSLLVGGAVLIALNAMTRKVAADVH